MEGYSLVGDAFISPSVVFYELYVYILAVKYDRYTCHFYVAASLLFIDERKKVMNGRAKRYSTEANRPSYNTSHMKLRE